LKDQHVRQQAACCFKWHSVYQLEHRKEIFHMKFDIVRAWKDEAYRQSLDADELQALPANPAGVLELSDEDLEEVQGGAGHFGVSHHNLGFASASRSRATHCLSYAVICDITLFSLDIKILGLDLLNIGSPTSQICINNG
jgi:mersacidin/lichenicidin family type 2 lantibiotic